MNKWLMSNNMNFGDANDLSFIVTGETRAKMKTVEIKYCQKKNIKCNKTYSPYGFTFTEIHNEQRPIFLICDEHLATESIKPLKLRRRLETNHSSDVDKSVEYFERLLQSTKTQKSNLEAHVSTNSKHKYLMKPLTLLNGQKTIYNW